MTRKISWFLSLSLLWISGQANACEQQLECLFPNSWQLSVAVGVGVRTNPLVDGDNVPLLILPDIAWYGEAAYFDNGELGYQWYEEDTHAFETFVHLDAERSFFSFWDPANIFLPLDTSFVSSPDFDNPEQAAPLEVSKNDYVIKPVEPRVLLARIQALLRRSNTQSGSSNSPQKMIFGQLTIDRSTRAVRLKGEDIQLTSHEFDMLWKLAQNASSLVERSTLYTELIGREYDGLDRSADVRISRLRKKLHDNSQHPYRIKTIWGRGFFFVADAWED